MTETSSEHTAKVRECIIEDRKGSQDAVPWLINLALQSCDIIDNLQAELTAKDEALEHILEYWNRDRNDTAMHDALWYIIETAEQALKGASD